MALLSGSPAIDAGNNALVPAGITTDQRGDPRIVNGTVDIGAYELQVVIVPSFVVNTTADFSDPTDGKTSLREAIASANALPGHTITFDPTVFASAQTITLTGTPARAEQHERDRDDHGPGGGRDGQRRRAEPGVPGRQRCHGVALGTDDHRRQIAGNGGGLYELGGTVDADQLHHQRQLGSSPAATAAAWSPTGGTTTLTNCTVSGNSAATTAAACTTAAARPR